MAEILSGKTVAAALNESIRADVTRLEEKGITPALAIVRAGERPDDIAYETGAIKRCAAVGVKTVCHKLPVDVSQEELLALINDINNDSSIHGCLIFRPLPKHISDDAVRAALAPEKDVDGITDASLAGVFSGSGRGFAPCTPAACMEILAHYGIDPKGKRAVVLGRSLVVGKPLSMLLLQKHATVTICHTRTVDLPAVCRNAEILIAAVGRAGVVKEDYLSPGQVVIDVGINVNEAGKLCGDVDYAAAEGIVGSITPVPGGVGSVTTTLLARNTVQSAMRSAAL